MEDLSLWWVLPARQKTALGQRVLRALSVVPEARPRRFGTFEPWRQQLAPDDDEPFLALWREEVARGGDLGWKASTPFRQGWASFPSETTREESLVGRETVVSVRIGVRPSGYTDPERREALVVFFAKLADRLGAVYASAGLARQAQLEAGIPPHLGGLDTIVIRGAWIGLPPVRTWLHWFGQPYVPELADLAGVVKAGRGLLLRRGEQPALTGELPGPPIPARLCWRGRTPEEERVHWDRERAKMRVFEEQQAATEAQGEPPPLRPRWARIDQIAAEVIPPIGARRLADRPTPSTPTTRKPTTQADAHPRLVWKDENGPGWDGGGHPDRVGPAWVERPDGSLEQLNDGAWIKREEAERLALENDYTFEAV